MCFKLNLFHSNLKDNVYAKLYFGKLYGATRTRTHHRLFVEIISSLKDSSHRWSHYLSKTQDYSLQTSLQSLFAKKESIIKPFCFYVMT